MLVTAATFQRLKSPLNVRAPGKSVPSPMAQWLLPYEFAPPASQAQNSPPMSVTCDTSQSAMWAPYVVCAAVGSASHAATAVLIAWSSKGSPFAHCTGAAATPSQLCPAGHAEHRRPSTAPWNPAAQLGYAVQSPAAQKSVQGPRAPPPGVQYSSHSTDEEVGTSRARCPRLVAHPAPSGSRAFVPFSRVPHARSRRYRLQTERLSVLGNM